MKNASKAIMITVILLISEIYACTGIRLISQDGSVVYARTLEFRQNIDSNILFIPKNYGFIGVTPFKDSSGLKWKAKYATLGANALNYKYFVDGVNETGLAGGMFYFPDYAKYQNITKKDASNSIASWQLLTWILTTCCSLKEVKKSLPKIKVSGTPFPDWNTEQPLHYIIHEPTGKSLVIEYVKGKLNFYDNPLGVITNSPGFNWHITNLRNYVNLTATNVPKVKLENLTLSPLGQGSGMLGIPGDFTPPSRFVRAVAYSQFIDKAKNALDNIDTAFRILNLFNIPKGIVKDKEGHSDYTQWTSASDLKNKKYYFNTYDNRQIFVVDLIKLKNKNKPLIMPMQNKGTILEIT